jgi:hypothetical protein
MCTFKQISASSQDLAAERRRDLRGKAVRKDHAGSAGLAFSFTPPNLPAMSAIVS